MAQVKSMLKFGIFSVGFGVFILYANLFLEGSVLEMGVVSYVSLHHGERLRATSKLLSTFDLSME